MSLRSITAAVLPECADEMENYVGVIEPYSSEYDAFEEAKRLVATYKENK